MVVASASPAHDTALSQPCMHSDLKSPPPLLPPQPCIELTANMNNPATPTTNVVSFLDMLETLLRGFTDGKR
jgi:hypothetical protein